MNDSTSIIGIVITSIVVFLTIATGILYYFIIFRHHKQQKQVADNIDISTTTKRIKISTTSF
jgi:preprotein translocase subunit YajC